MCREIAKISFSLRVKEGNVIAPPPKSQHSSPRLRRNSAAGLLQKVSSVKFPDYVSKHHVRSRVCRRQRCLDRDYRCGLEVTFPRGKIFEDLRRIVRELDQWPPISIAKFKSKPNPAFQQTVTLSFYSTCSSAHAATTSGNQRRGCAKSCCPRSANAPTQRPEGFRSYSLNSVGRSNIRRILSNCSRSRITWCKLGLSFSIGRNLC